ncbi:MAG TPA: DnaJ domain-containing protein [Burkholderiales bacterium]|nr:DnaJ domain-containing protein [Burkholderiales bacterium]
MKDYYRILGLGIDAEHEEIKAAYRILAQRYHPDKGGEHREFLLIQEAYDILSNPHTKRSYDKDLLRSIRNRDSSVPVIIKPANNQTWWLIIAILFTLGSVIFAYWAYTTHNNKVSSVPSTTVLTAPKPTLPVANTPAKQPSKKKVANKPQTKAVSSAPTQVINPLENLTGINYLINVGNYSTLAAAKAQQQIIKQQGFHPNIQHIEANSEGLGGYNLFIGPFQNQDNAYKVLDKLESTNIDATVERVDFN